MHFIKCERQPREHAIYFLSIYLNKKKTMKRNGQKCLMKITNGNASKVKPKMSGAIVQLTVISILPFSLHT